MNTPIPLLLVVAVFALTLSACDVGAPPPAAPAPATPTATGTVAATGTVIPVAIPAPAPKPATKRLRVRNTVDPATRAGVELAASEVAVAEPDEEVPFVDLLVAARGDYRLGADPLDLDGLTRELLILSNIKRDKAHPMQPSLVPLLITVDRRVRWRDVQWMMQAGAHPDIRMYRMYFTVKGEDGGEAALPVFLPMDRGASRQAEETKITVELKRREDETATRVKVLDLEIGRARVGFVSMGQRVASIVKAAERPLPVEINGWAWVPFEDVVRAVTLCRKAGVGDITFIGAPPPKKDR
jgi:biopolymer transport protein ExbD